MFRALLLSLFIVVPASATEPAPYVPANAMGFIHVRVAEMYKNPSVAEYRAMFEKAGPRALEALDAQIIPKPSTIVSLTAALVPASGSNPLEGLVVSIHFSESFDTKKVVETYYPEAKATANNKMLYVPADKAGTALFFPNDKTIVVGSASVLPKLSAVGSGSSPLVKGVQADADAGAVIYGAVNISALPIPPDAFAQVPEEFMPILKAESLSFATNIKDKATITVQANYADEAAAKQADKSLRKAAEMGRKFLAQPREQAENEIYGNKPKDGKYRNMDQMPMLFSAVAQLAGINYADEILANLPVTQEKSSLTFRANMPAWMTPYLSITGLSAGLMLPAVQKVREAAARAQSQNNLKQIGLAMHNYESAYQVLPTAAITTKKGKPLLSWRVTILPYIEQDALYKQFKLDEPWDSENNKKLIPMMPKIYLDPRATATEPGMTTYKVFVGKDTIFPPLKPTSLVRITDGTSNTIMGVSAGPEVVWTKPEDIEFDYEKPFPDLLGMPSLNPIMAVFGDGSVRALNIKGIDEKTLKNLVHASDGNVVNIP